MNHFFLTLKNLIGLYIAPWFVCFSIGYISVLTVGQIVFKKKKIKINNLIIYLIAFAIGAFIAGVPIAIFYYIGAENTARYAYISGGELVEGMFIFWVFIVSSVAGALFGGIGGIFATRKISKNRRVK